MILYYAHWTIKSFYGWKLIFDQLVKFTSRNWNLNGIHYILRDTQLAPLPNKRQTILSGCGDGLGRVYERAAGYLNCQ